MNKPNIKGRNTVALTKRRILVIGIAFLLFTSLLLGNLFKLQITGYNYYKEKVYDQITTTSPLRANRGKIYDSNLNLLAASETEWRVFISTKDIKKAEKENGKNYSALIASGLANILNLSRDKLLDKIKKNKRP